MYFFSLKPFFRYLIFYSLGILLAAYVPIFAGGWSICWLLPTFFLFVIGGNPYQFYWPKIASIGICSFLFCAGVWQTQSKIAHPLFLKDASKPWPATVVDLDLGKSKWRKVVLNPEPSFFRGATGNEKVLLYLDTAISPNNLLPGDAVLLFQNPGLIEGPKNPREFDYASYLKQKGILNQLFVSKRIGYKKKEGWRFMAWMYQIRSQTTKMVDQMALDDAHRGIIKALCTGYRGALTEEVQKSFKTAGVFHIVAISGMHVGMVLLLIRGLLGWLERWGWGKWFLLAFHLMGVLTLVCISGATPSVLRASIMAAIFLVGKAFGKKIIPLNLIAMVAFGMLLYHPFLIYDVGFQLSFMAVGSIACFYKQIAAFITFKWKPLNLLWQGAALSISAQILTLPLTLFYFAYFPIGFLVNNLVVMLLLPVVLYTALLLLFILACSGKTFGLDWILDTCTGVLVGSMEFLNIGVFEKWGVFSIDKSQVLLAYLLMLCLYILYRSRRLVYWLACSLVCCWYTLLVLQEGKTAAYNELLVYHVKGSAAIDLFNGGAIEHFYANGLQDKQIQFYLNPYRKWKGYNGLKNIGWTNPKTNYIFSFQDLRVLWMLVPSKEQDFSGYDILIVSNNALGEDQIKWIEQKRIILDGSNHPHKINLWSNELKKHKNDVISTFKHGAQSIKI